MAPQALDARQIFLEAVEKHAPEQWPAFLDSACGADAALRERVEALLQAHGQYNQLLDGEGFVATVERPVSERPGTQIGPYKLLQQIGEGGMGVVYMAEQEQPVRRRVALKIIKPGMDTRQVIARFEAERQALSLMDHPNIAKVLDAGTTESGRPYFVMELVKGQPITQYCDEKLLTPRQRLELLLPVCQAIQHAHQKGIIHRDIKPTNILVAEYDNQPVPKVIDFGVAKAISQALTEKTMFTGLGQIVGTLEYMSPEQAKVNQLDIDTRSDIYSLGVLLYELLTGSTPFDKQRLRSAAFDEMLRIIREEEPPKPSTRLSDSQDSLPSISAQRHMEPAKLTKLVRGELDWIVMKALEKDRSRRYETASGFAKDIEHFLNDEPVLACPPSAGYRLRKFVRRNKGSLAMTALVLFSLVLLGSVAGWAVRDRAAREAEVAQERKDRQAEAARQQGERQAKVAGQVESIFKELDRLEKEQKWPEALAAARRAEAAVAGGEADAATAERVRQRLKDLELIDRLERIRMQSAGLVAGRVEGKFDADGEYAKAFHDYGVEALELPVETSTDRLKARPALAIPLAVALDGWVGVRRTDPKMDDAGCKRLVTIAHAIDPEPLRDRLRSAPRPLTSEMGDELHRLAESIDVRAHHPATLFLLANTLGGDSAVLILRRAQAAYPGDFFLNYELGSALYDARYHSKQNSAEAIRFWTVAVALRPSAAKWGPSWLIPSLFRERGDLDEAIAAYRQAIEARPESTGHYWRIIGDILRDQKKPAEAADAYNKAIAAYRTAGDYYRIGEILRDQGKPDEAIAAYRLGIETDPALGTLLYRAIADIHIAQGKPDEAIAVYRQAIEAGPNVPDEAAAYWRAIGDILRDQKRPDEAIAAYRQAIEARPEGAAFILPLIGDILRDQKKLDEAADAYRKALEIAPNNSPVLFRLGDALIAQGKPADAIAAYRLVIETDPQTAVNYLLSIGKKLRDQKKPADAADAYRQAIQLKPDVPAYHHELGLALRDQKRMAESTAAFDRALELYRQAPDLTSADRYARIGGVLRDKGELDEAIAAFGKALDIAPTDAQLLRDLVTALRARGRPDEVIEVYRKALEADPKNFDLHQDLGAALVQQGKPDEAIAVYRQAIELAPTPNFAAGVYYRIGEALYHQKKMPEAIAAYYRVIELDPSVHLAPGAYLNLGIVLRDWGKPDEAAAAFRKVLEFNLPDATLSAYICLGGLLSQQNKLDEAVDIYRKIIELNSDSPRTHNALAWILATRLEASLRDPKEAVALAKRAVELRPAEGMFWNTLGVAQYRTGDWKEAVTALEKSMELRSGGDSHDWFFLAMAHWQLGEKDKAREWFGKAVEWMEAKAKDNAELSRFRAEAEELMKKEE